MNDYVSSLDSEFRAETERVISANTSYHLTRRIWMRLVSQIRMLEYFDPKDWS